MYIHRLFVKSFFFVLALLLASLAHAQTDTRFWFSSPEVNRYHLKLAADPTPSCAQRNDGKSVRLRITAADFVGIDPAIGFNVRLSMPANLAFVPIIRNLTPVNSTITIELGPYVNNTVSTIENRLMNTVSDVVSAIKYVNRSNKGLLLESISAEDPNRPGRPITAYYEIGIDYNMDLISLKGQNALGREFFIPFQVNNNTTDAGPTGRYYCQNKPYSSFDIVATESATNVTITPTHDVFVFGVGTVLPKNVPFTIRLERGQTAIIAPYENHALDYKTTWQGTDGGGVIRKLAGTLVTSTKNIAIITRDDLVAGTTTGGFTPGGVDYIADQIVPTNIIGTNYAVLRGYLWGDAVNNHEYAYVIATQDNTIVRENGVTDHNLSAGQTLALKIPTTTNILTIESINGVNPAPIYVYHASGRGAQMGGAIIPTISKCTGSYSVSFNRTKKVYGGNTYNFYFNILVWYKGLDIINGTTFFKLTDNNGVDRTALVPGLNSLASFTQVPGNPNWYYARLNADALDVVDGGGNAISYTLSNGKNVFHLGIINGAPDADAFYGYFSDFNAFKPAASWTYDGDTYATGCVGSDFQLEAKGGAEYEWSPTTFLDNPFSRTPIAQNVMYDVNPYTVKISGACDDFATRNLSVIVTGPVTGAFESDITTGCAPLRVQFTNHSTGHDPTKTQWDLNTNGLYTDLMYFKGIDGLGNPIIGMENEIIDDGNPFYGYFDNTTNAPIEYTVTLRLADVAMNCFQQVTKKIIVYPRVSVSPSVIIPDANGCHPLTVNFFSNPVGNHGAAYFNWDFGDNGSSSATNPTHIYRNLTNNVRTFWAKVKLTDQWNFCNHTDSVQITVQPFVKANFVINQPEGCSPLTVPVINDSKGGIAPGGYLWDRDGNGTFEYTGGGNWSLVYTNPNTDNTPRVVPITLRVSNAAGCSHDTTHLVTIYPRAVINSFNSAIAAGNDVNCSPITYNFTSTTTNTDSWSWAIDGVAFSSTQNTPYLFENYGATSIVRNITVTANNNFNCSATSAPLPITIQPHVNANFAIDFEEGCSPHAVTFTNTSSPGSVIFAWDIFNNGSTDAVTPNYSNTYNYNPALNNTFGLYTIPVKLTARNTAGCIRDVVKEIRVKPRAVATFTADLNGNTNLCSPVEVDFDGTYTNTEFLTWTFGDLGSSLDQDPFFILTNSTAAPKPVDVVLAVNNRFDCPTTVNQIFNVQPEVNAAFSLVDAVGCAPHSFTVAAPPTLGTYTWSYNSGNPAWGNGQTVQILENKTGVTQYYPITLTASSGLCSETSAPLTVAVFPEIQAKWNTPTPFAAQCSPYTLALQNQSDYYANPTVVANVLWQTYNQANELIHTSNNQSYSTNLTNLSFVNPTTYNIRLDATSVDGCLSNFQAPITINPPVNAQFTAEIVNSCTPMQVRLTDVSQTTPVNLNYNWNVDGGTETFVGSNVYVYDNADPNNSATRNISLFIRNQYGCSATAVPYSFQVYPRLTLDYIPPAPICSGLTGAALNFNKGLLSSGGAVDLNWNFQDGNTTTSAFGNVSHTFTNLSSTPFTLPTLVSATQVSTGCTATASIPVTVYPKVQAGYSFKVLDLCEPMQVELTNSSLNGSNFSWTFTPTNAFGALQNAVTNNHVDKPVVSLPNTDVDNNVTYNIAFNAQTVWNAGMPSELTCQDNAAAQAVVAAPRLNLVYNAPAPICSGLSGANITFNKVLGSTGGAANLNWNFQDGNTTTSAFGNVSHTFTNLSSTPFTLPTLVSATQTATGCTATASIPVTVYPKVQAGYSFKVLDLCEPMQVELTNSTLNGSNFSWTFTPTNAFGALQNAATNNHVDKPVVSLPNTDVDNNVTYNIAFNAQTVWNAGMPSELTCQDNAAAQAVVAAPRLNLVYNAPAPICSGLSGANITFNKVLGSTGGAASLNWNFQDGNTTTSAFGNVSHTFTNLSSTPFTLPTLVSATQTATGCTATASIPVTVYPKVQAGYSFKVLDLCEPMQVELTNSSLNGSNFSWTFTPTNAFGALQNAATNNHVDKPVVSLPNTDVDNNVTYNIAFNAQTVWNAGMPSELTCQDNAAAQAIVAAPRLNLVYNAPAPICSGLSGANITFNKVLGSTGGAANLNWNFQDGNTATSQFGDMSHTFINLGPNDFTLPTLVSATQIATGCTANTAIPVRIHPKVESIFTFRFDSLCTPFNAVFTNSSINGTQFDWNYGYSIGGVPQTSSTVAPQFEHTFTFDNDLPNTIISPTITLTSNQYHAVSDLTCSHSSSKPITVNPRLVSNFNLNVTEGCNPLTVEFTNVSSGLGQYLWSFGDNTGSAAGSPTPKIYSHTDKENSKSYDIRLRATNNNGCIRDRVQTVTVYPLVEANFIAENPIGCSPLDVTFQNLSTSSAYQYNWDFVYNGQVSNLVQPGTITFENIPTNPLQNYNPVVSLTTGLNATYPQTCAKTVTTPITVHPRVYPQFTANFEGCNPHPVVFNNQTNAFGGTSNATYLWKFGNQVTSTQQNPSQTYLNTSFTDDKIFNVWLLANSEHGCKDSVENFVTVFPKPKSKMELVTPYMFCPGVLTEIDNQSIGTALTYLYEFGDGVTPDSTTVSSDNMVHEYNNLGSDIAPYTISLTATTENDCVDRTSQTLYVFPRVIADFNFNPGNAACNPFTVTMLNETTNAYYYTWNFDYNGLSSSLYQPTHRFVNSSNTDREYNVNLYAMSEYECEHDTTKVLTVYASPVADFAIDPPLKVFPDATFGFTNFTTPSSPSWLYTWTFGDGYNSNQMNPGTHTYETWGPRENSFVYPVWLKVVNDHCKDSIQHFLTLRPAVPQVSFSSEHYEACSPLEVFFINESQYGSSYSWSFGDSIFSNSFEPSFTFTEPGYYNVKLVVTGDGGERHFYRTYQVYQNPTADFRVAPEIVQLPNASVHLYDLSQYAHTYLWNMGDGATDNVPNPIHTYSEIGEYRITLTVWTEQGCENTISKFPAVWVEGKGNLKFPNAFIPSKLGANGGAYDEVDYKNEVFHPIHQGVDDFKMLIFNRWGEQLFESNDINIGWDGYYNGKLCPQDVYVWRVTGRYVNGELFDMRGNVTLLR